MLTSVTRLSAHSDIVSTKKLFDDFIVCHADFQSLITLMITYCEDD